MSLDNYTCGHKGCKGTLVYRDDDYGSLGSGGSCEVYKCDQCGKVYRFMLAD